MTTTIAALLLTFAIMAAILSLPGWAWSRRWTYKPFALAAMSVPVIEAMAFIGLR